jgi:glutathione synthase/RimK-type ligase-like ATP-grasp enzyme
MIACLYGEPATPFLAPVVRDLCASAVAAGGKIVPITIEAALRTPECVAETRVLYCLPFDLPAPDMAPSSVIHRLCPRAELVTSFAAQDLCFDKLATLERLRDRGLPLPETLVSHDSDDVWDFVRRHRYAVLKEQHSSAGQGDFVVWIEDGELMGDTGSHRYILALTAGGRRMLQGERLYYPAPFCVQRLVADITPPRVRPGQVLRAYVVDNEIPFWTERYRDRFVRPSDWLVSAARGARYRFVLSVSEEARKLALRCAEVLGLRVAVVDLIRTGSGGPYVLDVDTDGRHTMIDRQFKAVPEYRDFFNLDRYVAEAILADPPTAVPRPPRPPREL